MAGFRERLVVVVGATALLALTGVVTSSSQASASVPAVFRVCALVPWDAPSLEQQRRHLGRNSRWSTADRSDAAPALEFPFVVRIRSASISYDQGHLAGLWTLSRRASKRLGACPVAGGPRRNYVVLMKGWQVVRAELTDGGDLVAYGRPRLGFVQALLFPGYGSRDGAVHRDLMLERIDGPACAISAIEGGYATYTALMGTGMSCEETRRLQATIDATLDWDAPIDGFTCAVGATGYTGDRVVCADGSGRALRFGYSEAW